MARERAAHRFDRRGVAKAQRREALAELGAVDVTRGIAGARHGANCTIVGPCEAMIMRDTRPGSRRFSLSDRSFGRRSSRVTPARA